MVAPPAPSNQRRHGSLTAVGSGFRCVFATETFLGPTPSGSICPKSSELGSVSGWRAERSVWAALDPTLLSMHLARLLDAFDLLYGQSFAEAAPAGVGGYHGG